MRKEQMISGRKIKNVLFQALCIGLGIILIFPVIYAVIISFTPQDEILTRELRLLPSVFGYIENYKIVFSDLWQTLLLWRLFPVWYVLL